MAQNGTDCTDWKPKPRQLAVMECAKQAGLKRNIEAITTEAGVPKRTFYNWLRDDPCFVRAWEAVWRESVTRHLPGVVSAMIHAAQEGDTRAAKIVLDISGVVKQTLTVQTWEDELVALLVAGTITPDEVVAELGEDMSRPLLARARLGGKA